ncbi:hypothetical protein CAPTEDRAFT_190912 [Capitella teleta]|uniref:VPS37 C-terminal domain-containing protein n=1 Tax=Capitella teleta TaxID=283909 RepID=R7UME3_CAPTE|nr:hypothetical protein CAPTEDRAFT_190912 [Capitella teleta]|eukprot:ELU07709.1 hypothetical protein CAPTEDRAFT_190912 [Capitella teleta]
MFGWLSGRQQSELPEPTALQVQRSNQIDWLKAANQNVTEIQRDVEYRVNTSVKGVTISLFVTLPPQFPQDKPVVKVSPPLTHPWVNNQMQVVDCYELNAFNMHYDLGKVIRGIVEEFQRNPPLFPPQQSTFSYNYPPNVPTIGGQATPRDFTASLQSYSPAPAAKSTLPYIPPNKGQFQYQNPVANIPGRYAMPDVPEYFSQLKDLSISELRELSADESKLLQMIGQMPEVQKLSDDQERMCGGNECLARENLNQRPILEESKKKLLEKYDQLNELRTQFDDLSKKQDDVLQRYDLSTLQDRLKVAAEEAEEASEKIADEFLDDRSFAKDERGKNAIPLTQLACSCIHLIYPSL